MGSFGTALSVAAAVIVLGTTPSAQASALLNALRSGDKAKMDKAIESIETERVKLIHGLRKILEDNWDERDEDTDAIKCALTALGKLKAVESIDLLIKYIDFSILPTKRERPEDGLNFISPHIEYPTVSALMEIGPCVVEDR